MMFGSMMQAFKNIFLPVHTHPYPAKPIERPPQYRGLIEYGLEACIFCDKCENVCPPGAILFYHHDDDTKEYHYNAHLCIYCGECVRACPKPGEALWQSETKALPGIMSERINSGWFELEREVALSKERSRERKAAKKAAKAAGKG